MQAQRDQPDGRSLTAPSEPESNPCAGRRWTTLRHVRPLSILAAPFLTACNSPQSTFLGAGTEAAAINVLLYWMAGGALLIWLIVLALAFYASKANPETHGDRAGLRLILWGGAVFPTVVLTVLLIFGLRMMPEFRREADGPRIAISGERFWWRIHYDAPDQPGVGKSLSQEGIESANELWLPIGTRTELLLGSPDVIHSFWVPALAGKTDMIPGRINRLVLEPTREGVFYGVCAEYCGTAHAQMSLRVRVVSQAEFDAHLTAQNEPAAVTDHPGRELFLRNGCSACHRIRGTEADGRVGPDLTHVGGRTMIGAGILEMSETNLARFIRSSSHEKPGVQMPAFGALPDGEVAAIAAWLRALR